MSFLLDTNTVSEWVRPRPNSGLMSWMESADEDRIFISVISFAELRYGVDRMAQGAGVVGWSTGFGTNYQYDSRTESCQLTLTSLSFGAEPFPAARPPDARSAQWTLFLRPRRKPIS